MRSDQFGVLLGCKALDFPGYSICQKGDYATTIGLLKEHSSGGFCTGLPGSRRPADNMFDLPSTHCIRTVEPCQRQEFRNGVGYYLIQQLGYLYGFRPQFAGWWFDGRVPLKSQNSIVVSDTRAAQYLTQAMTYYARLDDNQRRIMTNVLTMHNRAMCYYWDWEQFAIEYMVFDGIWKLYKLGQERARAYEKLKKKIGMHKARFSTLCDVLNLHYDENMIDNIVTLRNRLFHEMTWDKGMPCTACSRETMLYASNLRRLNQRLIAAITVGSSQE